MLCNIPAWPIQAATGLTLVPALCAPAGAQGAAAVNGEWTWTTEENAELDRLLQQDPRARAAALAAALEKAFPGRAFGATRVATRLTLLQSQGKAERKNAGASALRCAGAVLRCSDAELHCCRAALVLSWCWC